MPSLSMQLFTVVSCQTPYVSISIFSFFLLFTPWDLIFTHSFSFLSHLFQVSSLVQVVGIILCLHAATKISHRAQGIASLASKWHALSTCSSTDTSQLRTSNSTGNLEVCNRPNSLNTNYSESDLESLDYVVMPTSAQLVSYMSSYHKRQAFGMKIKVSCFCITSGCILSSVLTFYSYISKHLVE